MKLRFGKPEEKKIKLGVSNFLYEQLKNKWNDSIAEVETGREFYRGFLAACSAMDQIGSSALLSHINNDVTIEIYIYKPEK